MHNGGSHPPPSLMLEYPAQMHNDAATMHNDATVLKDRQASWPAFHCLEGGRCAALGLSLPPIKPGRRVGCA